MKTKLYLILTAFCILSSCSPTYLETVRVVDFSKYVDEGFYIYPLGTEIKEKNYIPISSIQLNFYAGKENDYSKSLPKDSYVISSFNGYVVPKGDYIISRFVDEAKKFKADGIIDFQVKDTNEGWIATGTAVKIK
jgi:hypothetical protein